LDDKQQNTVKKKRKGKSPAKATNKIKAIGGESGALIELERLKYVTA